MVGHVGVFVKVLFYFVQAFISKVGLRNVLGTISEFSVNHFFGGGELIFYSSKKYSRKSGSIDHKRGVHVCDLSSNFIEIFFSAGVTNQKLPSSKID